jgi:SAM-dependent methyltransferase
MERSVHAIDAAIEETHWWFSGRRRLFARELARGGVTARACALDTGTSAGVNLRLLRELGFRNITGLDISEDAIAFCEGNGFGPVEHGDICAMPFADDSFDLVLATDVIEHVEEDDGALREIARVLRPGGTLLLTVPAFELLWGLQDRVAQHKRRYRLKPLAEKLTIAGLRVQRAYYFNYLLFIPILLARRAIDALGLRWKNVAQANAPLLNGMLAAIFDWDIRTAPLVKPPFGVSILVMAAK